MGQRPTVKRKADDVTVLLTVDGEGKTEKRVALSNLLVAAFEAGAECALAHEGDYKSASGELVRAPDFWCHMGRSAQGHSLKTLAGK